MALELEIEYLAGVAFAAAAPGTGVADWPPQPDRVFSALVASWAARGQSADEEQALQWLEALPPPLIRASEGSERMAHISFVPPNDPTSAKQKHALGVVPQLRERQPRRFPATRPQDPCVQLRWAGAQPDGELLASLAALASDTSYVGHSASLTRCHFRQLADDAPLDGFKPARRSVYPGRFRELVAAFTAGTRPHPGAAIPAASLPPPQSPARSAFSDRWLVLEQATDEALPDLRATARAAKAIRNRLVTGYGDAGLADRVPAVLSGRSADGSPLQAPHLAIVPLAFVGFPHADGHLLGFGLVPPRASGLLDDPEFLEVLRAVFPWDASLGRRILHLDLPEIAGHASRIGLSPTVEPSWQSCEPRLYVTGEGGPATTFATVTPIALDRHPKERGAARDAEIAAEVARMCRNIGLPEPMRLEKAAAQYAVVPDKHSAVEGCPPAWTRPGSPPWTAWQTPAFLAGRYLTHAVLQFAEPVEGPVILGAGRHLGLGLCRPIRLREGSTW